jgi:hypothetical protein
VLNLGSDIKIDGSTNGANPRANGIFDILNDLGDDDNDEDE